MRRWFKDHHFKSLLKNSGYLASSKSVSAVAGIATLAFAGRALGLVEFGFLVLIASYASAVSEITKFQSWQVIIRYGGSVLAGGDPERFKEATSFAFGLDVASGLIGMVAAIVLLPWLGPKFGIPPHYIRAAMLYCTLLPVMVAATANGALRALDRFDLLSWQGTINPISRAIMAGIAWAYHAPLEVFVAIWYVSDLGGDLYLWFLAWRELKRRDLVRGIRPILRSPLPGAWRFAINVNLTTSLTSAWGPFARLIVGAILGPASAALYRVAASLADSAAKPADLLGRAFYPEIMRMDLASKHPWRLMLRSIAASALVSVVAVILVVIAGRPLLGWVFGKDFVAAYPVLLIMLGVPLLAIMSFPLPSMLYALDRPDAPLKARMLAAASYLLLVFPLGRRFGIDGAAFAYLVANAVLVATLALFLRAQHRRVRGR
jgi:O-antigen/teichoic acid export membrane protein